MKTFAHCCTCYLFYKELEDSQNFWTDLGESPKKPEEMEEPEEPKEPKGAEKFGESDEELSLPVQEGSSDENEAELILQSVTKMKEDDNIVRLNPNVPRCRYVMVIFISKIIKCSVAVADTDPEGSETFV